MFSCVRNLKNKEKRNVNKWTNATAVRCQLTCHLFALHFVAICKGRGEFSFNCCYVGRHPWANASSSFVPQLGLLLCFSMFDALKWFCLKTIYFTYEWFLWKRLRNWLTKYVRQELKNKLWNISLWKRATRLVKATRFIHVMYHCPASNG